MRRDRIFAAAFVALVSTAMVGFTAGSTTASFTASTDNPGSSWNTSNVAAPASQSAPVSAIAGRVDLSWAATTTPANGHTVTYLVLRNGTQVGTSATTTYSDTPPSDGTNSYTIQTKIAQGAGFFTSGNSPAQNGLSDRTAPTMSATCNGGSCAGWFNGSVSVVVSGNDGTGVGTRNATTNLDGAGAVTSAAPRTITVSGESSSSGHTVVYSGDDQVGNTSGNTTANVKIDLTKPTTPGSFAAASGPAGAPYTVNFTWTAATDALSGVASQTLHWVEVGTLAACPATATTGNFPNAVPLGAAATSTSVNGSGVSVKICGYIESTDNAGNVSNPSAITNALAL